MNANASEKELTIGGMPVGSSWMSCQCDSACLSDVIFEPTESDWDYVESWF